MTPTSTNPILDLSDDIEWSEADNEAAALAASVYTGPAEAECVERYGHKLTDEQLPEGICRKTEQGYLCMVSDTGYTDYTYLEPDQVHALYAEVLGPKEEQGGADG